MTVSSAWVWRYRSALVLAALALPAGALELDVAERHVRDATNRFRAAHGLAPLSGEARLAATANDFARFLAEGDRFGHQADGRDPPQRAKRHGYDYCMVAENIGYQYRSHGFESAAQLAEGFVDGWKRSPGHRANLEDREATEIGVGIARSAKSGRYYGVQVFGRPASLELRFTVANESARAIDYLIGDQRYSLAARTERSHRECRAEPLVLLGERLAPRAGQRFAVVEERGALRLRR